jgi:hypothetical protein
MLPSDLLMNKIFNNILPITLSLLHIQSFIFYGHLVIYHLFAIYDLLPKFTLSLFPNNINRILTSTNPYINFSLFLPRRYKFIVCYPFYYNYFHFLINSTVVRSVYSFISFAYSIFTLFLYLYNSYYNLCVSFHNSFITFTPRLYNYSYKISYKFFTLPRVLFYFFQCIFSYILFILDSILDFFGFFFNLLSLPIHYPSPILFLPAPLINSSPFYSIYSPINPISTIFLLPAPLSNTVPIIEPLSTISSHTYFPCNSSLTSLNCALPSLPILSFSSVRSFSTASNNLIIDTSGFDFIINEFSDILLSRKHIFKLINPDLCGVYVWTNTFNNKQYVGSSSNLRMRLGSYFYPGSSGISYPIHNAIKKYGFNSFSLSVKFTVDIQEARLLEQDYLNDYTCSYNLVRIVDAATFTGTSSGISPECYVHDIVDNTVKFFANKRLACDYLDCNYWTIHNYLKSKYLYRERYFFTLDGIASFTPTTPPAHPRGPLKIYAYYKGI